MKLYLKFYKNSKGQIFVKYATWRFLWLFPSYDWIVNANMKDSHLYDLYDLYPFDSYDVAEAEVVNLVTKRIKREERNKQDAKESKRFYVKSKVVYIRK